ncbi:hypothetical protein SARC_15733, partial [Sphaeroforma arctica JP610]
DLIVRLSVEDSFFKYPIGLTAAQTKDFFRATAMWIAYMYVQFLKEWRRLAGQVQLDGVDTWIKRSKGPKINANHPLIELIADYVKSSRDLLCTYMRDQFNPLTTANRGALRQPPTQAETDLMMAYRATKTECNTYKDRGLKVDAILDLKFFD